MNDIKYWEQFSNTGRIEDYLTYTNSAKVVSEENLRQVKNEGDSPYAGASYRDGDDFKPDAYR